MKDFLKFVFRRFFCCPAGFHDDDILERTDKVSNVTVISTYKTCQVCGLVRKYNSAQGRFLRL